MKFLIIAFILALTQFAYGQETILKKGKSETFYVLKDNPEIKHGEYSKKSKKEILEEGLYENGARIGIWNFYDSNGKIEQIYNYSTGEVIENNNEEQFSNYQIVENGLIVEGEPDILPIFIGGRARYDRFINENLEYPKSAKSDGIEGKQFVLITLSKSGKVINTKVYKSITSDLDDEALRLIGELPKEWIAAKYENRNIEVVLAVPVLFKL